MVESKKVVEYDDPAKTFLGVRFILLGFDSVTEDKVRLKLFEGGGIDAVNYGPDCTHVIVDKCTYDNPTCIAARRDGKTVVNALWVDHSFDVGMPVDPSSVMYWPMRDLNGIPGAKSLVVCLTGYQRQDRDDIMNMVALMGGNFSKPLVANKVTHLICYKFEGEKYELAKKLMKIKLVNHRWLEDCLKAWELLPESDYYKSGYELELMAEAKDSEEETEDVATKVDLGRKNVEGHQNTRAENRSLHLSPAKLKISWNGSQHLSASTVFKIDGTIGNKIHSTPEREIQDEQLKIPSPVNILPRVPSNTLEYTNISEKVDHVLASATERNKKSPDVDMSKLSHKRNCKSTPCKQSSSLRSERIQQSSPCAPSASTANSLGGSDSFHIGIKIPPKQPLASHDEVQPAMSPKSKTAVSRGSSKSPSLNLHIDCEVKTPLVGTHDAGQTEKSLNSSKKRVLKSSIFSHDAKISMGNELATKSVDHVSGLASDIPQKAVSSHFVRTEVSPLAPEEPPNISLRGLQVMPSSNVKDFFSIHSDVQDIEPPVEKLNLGTETTGRQDDPSISNEGNTAPQTKPIKRKLLVKKSLGSNSRRTIGKGSTSKLKGALNLQKAILKDESVARSNGAIPMKATDDATVDNETKAQSEEVEAPHLGRGDIISEKLASSKTQQMEENGTGAIKAVIREKTELSEVKDKSDGEKKTISKGKKRPLANTKTIKSKDFGDRVKKDEKKDGKKSVPTSEEIVLLAGKTKKRPSKKSKSSADVEKENDPAAIKQQGGSEKLPKHCLKTDKSSVNQENGTDNLELKAEPAWFILSGHRLQRKDFQQLIRRLKGRVCRDSHNWSYQATHFVVPDPVKRTEKFFAAAASGSWILKTEYLTSSNEAGRFLPEEPYEWHKKCLTEDGAINLEAPRKWRLLKEKTGHGAFYGMRIVIYGECIAPTLDTLKRAIKAGDGTILATSPPYTRFLRGGIDFAIVSPGMPRVDMWVREFLSHEVPCVVADYLVEYVCKPGYPLERHVQYNTHSWAQKMLENLTRRVEEVVEDVKTPPNLCNDDVACRECGSRDRGEEMLICGDESGSFGCGIGVHLDCLNPPLCSVPEEDWFCAECARKRGSSKKKACKTLK